MRSLLHAAEGNRPLAPLAVRFGQEKATQVLVDLRARITLPTSHTSATQCPMSKTKPRTTKIHPQPPTPPLTGL